jgi:hypothetical protein
VNKASRKQRGARRRAVESRQRTRCTPLKVDDHGGGAVADVELNRLLTDRGWVEVDRIDELTVYDWPPSAPDQEHEFTYLIIDLRGEPGAGPPYRVSVVNGDRLMYGAESELVADLDTIEASRCAGCMPCLQEAAR